MSDSSSFFVYLDGAVVGALVVAPPPSAHGGAKILEPKLCIRFSYKTLFLTATEPTGHRKR